MSLLSFTEQVTDSSWVTGVSVSEASEISTEELGSWNEEKLHLGAWNLDLVWKHMYPTFPPKALHWKGKRRTWNNLWVGDKVGEENGTQEPDSK